MINQNYIPVYDTAMLNDNLEHSGGITLSWKSATDDELPVGASIVLGDTKYSLLDPYAPTRNDAVSFSYSPTFLHPINRLDRVPFYISSTDSEGNPIQLSNASFTGRPSTIAQKLADFFTEYGRTDAEFAQTFGTWTASLNVDKALISVNFDGCSIKAAASRIADAIGCNVFFDWDAHVIRFIAGSSIEGETYNCFHVLGGTTNMAKKTVSGMYAAVTQALTLDPVAFPGSIMDYSNGTIRLTKDLILPDIYPKAELFVKSVRERRCWLTDEEGNRIPDTYTTDASGNRVPATYKQYSKWYVRLRYANGTDYALDKSIMIADKPLSILFQPNYEDNAVSSPLAGRQFEVVYFEDGVLEWEEDDVADRADAFYAERGEFRIIFNAEGSTILPSISEEGLIPHVGNKVTLVNVALGSEYIAVAREELRVAALEIVALMAANKGEYRGTVIGSCPSVGSAYTLDGHSGIVVDVNTNLDTEVSEVTIGGWTRKTITGGMSDKIDAISITGGEATQADKTMSKSQFEALRQTQVKPGYNDRINALNADIRAIKEQDDKQFMIWFGTGTPTLSNYPAVDWLTDADRAAHVQDIYYDTNREAASTGGRAWRFILDGTYQWDEITDLDTIASLEKIADIASDGILSGGSEKTRLFIDWCRAREEYEKYSEQTQGYGIDAARTAYITAYTNLWTMLNGGTAGSSITDTPSWLTNLSTDTKLSDYSVTPAAYRSTWDAYYDALAALLKASAERGMELTEAATTLAQSKMAFHVSENLPVPPYAQGDLWLKLYSASSTDGDLYLCSHGREEGDTAAMSDWQPVGDQYLVSVVNLLAEMSDIVEKPVGDFLSTEDSVKVFIQPSAPPAYDADEGDIWLDPESSGDNCVMVKGSSTWMAPSEEWDDVSLSELKRVVAGIYALQGDMTFSFRKNLDVESSMYDVCFKRSTFHDNFTNSDIEGGLAIWIRGKSTWEHIRDNVASIMENYGDHLVLATFGTSPQAGTNYAAGLTTKMNFAEMFVNAADPDDGELKTKAGIQVHVETDEDTGEQKGYVDVIGSFRSADGTVCIEKSNSSQGSISSTRSSLVIKKGEEVYAELSYGSHGRPGLSSNGTQLTLMNSRTTSDKKEHRLKGVFNPSWVSAQHFAIAEDAIYNAETDTWDYPDIEGVGEVNNPAFFYTQDGKVITVMGGIIVDSQESSAATKIERLTQSEYDALTTKDSNTLYIVTE